MTGFVVKRSEFVGGKEKGRARRWRRKREGEKIGSRVATTKRLVPNRGGSNFFLLCLFCWHTDWTTYKTQLRTSGLVAATNRALRQPPGPGASQRDTRNLTLRSSSTEVPRY